MDCKKMLLQPKNAVGSLCKKLKLNVDETEPIKYFVCSNYKKPHLSYLKGSKCECNRLVDMEVELRDDYATADRGGYNGVFIKSDAMFVISDDLHVLPASYDSILLLLNKLGISEIKRLKHLTLDVGLKEFTRLLELSLYSKSPLTDMFVRDGQLDVYCHRLPPGYDGNLSETPSNCQKMTINLVFRKSDCKVLYAEAREDFIDFLFSILTLQLGYVVEICAGNSSLSCIDNLYKCINDLNVERYMVSDLVKNTLISPKLPPSYEVKNQPFDMKEMSASFQCHTSMSYNFDDSRNRHLSLSDHCPCQNTYKAKAIWLDPKLSASSTTSPNGYGYVKGPADFMVTDGLVVSQLSSFSSICLLNNLEVEFRALGQRVISVGKEEALCLLKASLTSTSALTTGLSYILRKPEEEN